MPFKCHGAHIGAPGVCPCTSLHDEQCILCTGAYSKQQDDNSAETVATQVVALTLQSQLMANTVANISQRQDQSYQHLAHQQTLLHANQHQILGHWPPYPSMQATRDKGKHAAVTEDVDTHPPLTLTPLPQCKALYQPTLQVLEAEAMDTDADKATPRLRLLEEWHSLPVVATPQATPLHLAVPNHHYVGRTGCHIYDWYARNVEHT
jgi:hypothetical protein